VVERIDMRRRDVRVGGEIAERVEAGRRVTPLEPAELLAML